MTAWKIRGLVSFTRKINFMKYLICLVFFVYGIFDSRGQGVTIRELKDSSQLKRLDVFAGKWVSFAIGNISGKSSDTAVTICQWSSTGRYLICDQIIRSKTDTITNLVVYSYDFRRKEYQFYVAGSSGEQPFSATLTIKDNIWTYSGEYTEQGKIIKSRTLNVFNATNDFVEYKVQFSNDNGQTWNTRTMGKEIKISNK